MLSTGLLNDEELRRLSEGDHPMIVPFVHSQCGKPSWGLGSYGYDLRLGPDFIFLPENGVLLDPLNFPHNACTKRSVQEYLDLPPRTTVLGESLERFIMPPNVLGICMGKSTYARAGLLLNLTPAEPGWVGTLTIEITNLTGCPIRLHVGQGIGQMVFIRGTLPSRTYAQKGGIYNNQSGPTPPR